MGLNELYLDVYRSPLERIALVMAAALCTWTLLRALFTLRFARVWKWLNRGLVVLSVALILVVSFWNRTPGNYPPVLMPFASLIAAQRQPEYYREMLMNILLYLPFGLFIGSSWETDSGAWRSLGRTVLCGATLSLLMECAQGVFRLGTMETDDLIRNTLGTLLGAIHVPLACLLQRGAGWITSSCRRILKM